MAKIPTQRELNDYVTGGISELAIGTATASQLPGRGFGGPADALRHLVLSAELARRFGDDAASGLLAAHEAEDTNPDRAGTKQDASGRMPSRRRRRLRPSISSG
jgi:hypothetical protein